MTSKIKIIRKFLSLVSNNSNTKNFTLSRYFNDCYIGSYKSGDYAFSLEETSTHILYLLNWYQDKNTLLIDFVDSGTKSIKIDDIDEFLQEEDMVLILKYSRDILDENIIELINIFNSKDDPDVTIDNFKEYFEL